MTTERARYDIFIFASAFHLMMPVVCFTSSNVRYDMCVDNLYLLYVPRDRLEYVQEWLYMLPAMVFMSPVLSYLLYVPNHGASFGSRHLFILYCNVFMTHISSYLSYAPSTSQLVRMTSSNAYTYTTRLTCGCRKQTSL